MGGNQAREIDKNKSWKYEDLQNFPSVSFIKFSNLSGKYPHFKFLINWDKP